MRREFLLQLALAGLPAQLLHRLRLPLHQHRSNFLFHLLRRCQLRAPPRRRLFPA
jgi:hypothetical protein